MGFFFFKQKTAYEMLRSLVGSEMCIRDRGSRSLTYEDFSWDKFFETNFGNINDEYIYNSIEKYRQDTLSHLNELIEIWQ